MDTNEIAWKGAVTTAAIAGGVLANKVATAGWEKAAGEVPPQNPAAPDTSWSEALTWAAVLGLSMGVARVVARRGAAEAWKAVDGDYPAELLTDTDAA